MNEDRDGGRSTPESSISQSNHNSRRTEMFAVLAFGIAILLTIFLARSFKGIEYNQFGFKRRKASGKVDTDTVYSGGRYPIGITFNFKTFPADAHILELWNLEVFTSDRLQVSLDCALQYFLRIEDLKLLHDNYDLQYESVLEDSARDAIKSAATRFSTRDYGIIRGEIEEALFVAARVRLGGLCCPIWCDLPTGGCNSTGCIPRESDSCGPDQLGLFASVRFFQLLYVEIDPNVMPKSEDADSEEDAKKEVFLQSSQLVRLETLKMASTLNNFLLRIFLSYLCCPEHILFHFHPRFMFMNTDYILRRIGHIFRIPV
ncbi:hypothetical protein BSL78_03732 [Apostichopus japonicus]|uniref:Band 7 domain-containing protein n=1 Tax=Stichopus japonicus TaxID=307972 RepID=A0A2G8LGI2_STIJA|nr:hypothetical protein BSL78_03732 [Apostichopus japonicus]